MENARKKIAPHKTLLLFLGAIVHVRDTTKTNCLCLQMLTGHWLLLQKPFRKNIQKFKIVNVKVKTI